MDWMGIGVLLIGIAFVVLVILLIKPLNKAADLLEGLQETTDRLPDVVDDVSAQATDMLQTSNATLDQVNSQVHSLNPFFHIVGDTGKAARTLSLSALEKTNLLKAQTASAMEYSKREKYEGLYGILSFLFFLSQRRKEMKEIAEISPEK
ncbi:DUF948 domain-containing protein [Sporosarcina sp. FSL W7-1349]|uniref:DUF948 domain-containing protein n=1 Tax=Sporosarcina sp. FSL W7-1349 TaxID=2921561 RepID=UPI0030FA630E